MKNCVQLLQFTAAAELVRASPDFVLTGGSNQVGTVYSWGALAAGVSTALASQTAILTLQTNFNCDGLAELVIFQLHTFLHIGNIMQNLFFWSTHGLCYIFSFFNSQVPVFDYGSVPVPNRSYTFNFH